MYFDKHIAALEGEYEQKNIKLNVVAGGVLHGVRTVEDEEALSMQIAGKIIAEVGYYRKEIIPHIKYLTYDIDDMTKTKTRQLVVHAPDVVQYFVPAWFTGLLNDGTLEDFTPTQYLPGKVVSIPRPKLFTMFLNQDFPKDVKEFIARIPEATFARVWDMYMTDISKNNDNILDLFNTANVTKESQYDIFIVLLFLLSMEGKELPIGTVGTLGDVRANIKSLRQAIIHDLVMKKTQMSENKAMLLHSNKQTNTLVVNNTLYKDFLTKASIDVLYGAFYAGVSTATADMLISDTYNLTDVWEKEYKRIAIEVKQSSEIIFKSAYIELMDRFFLDTTGYDKTELVPVIRDYINGLNSEELSNVTIVLEHILGQIIYKKTNLTFFLREVRNYGKGTDLETAVTYATASMVAAFLSSQITKHV